MKRILIVTSLLALALVAARGALYVGAFSSANDAPAQAAPAIGKAAPEFTAVDTYGKTHPLSQYRGNWVVLEWLNHGCPYVRKHYDNKAMQALQKKYAEKGVTWLSVASSARFRQGHYSNDKANALTKDKGAAPHAVLADASGTVGRMYAARTTPHMFVINPEGTLLYMGAIDGKPSTRASDLKTARPHVDIALQEAMAGRPVSVPTTQPYGCSVKY